MAFGAPEWLVVLPFLAFAAWRWRGLALWRLSRLAALGLLALALAEPRLTRGGKGLDVWLLVDRSASARDLVEPRRAEIETLLERSRSAQDALHVVDFAEEAALRSESQGFTPRGTETRIASAIRFALGRMRPERSARLLLLTDGFSTEPLDGLAERLLAQGVPLDLRRVSHERAFDYRVESLTLPESVQPGEPFVIEAHVAGSPDGEVDVTVLRDGEVAGQGRALVKDGWAVVRFTDALKRGGAFRYAVQLHGKGDPVPGNDRAEAWTSVRGGPRVVLVTAYAGDPLAHALEAQGFAVDLVREPGLLSVGRLAGARLVVFNNVPAHRIPPDVLSAIDAFVRVQGGGLLMCGGRSSFGAGGYFKSDLDGLLPVSMELRQEHRKLAVALAIVLDRSGSMAASVGGGATKMDLADAGAASSIELLGEQDGVAIIAVDSEAHRVVPLSSLGKERGRVADLVRRIQSTGGGIYVYTGLKAAWEELKNAPYGQRHVILFADAADAEEPGDYIRLLTEITSAGGTVSVIGLGRESDSDAAFLKDVAARGKGRMFFAENAATLPAVFAQETVAVARSAFLDEATEARPAAGWLEVAAQPMEWPASVDGYNLSYLKPDATAALVTKDEYQAPLVAFWQRGAGRAAAVSFPVGGEHSAAVRAWPRYSDFLQTLARWLAGQDLPPGIGLKTRREGTHLRVDLLYDASWEERLAAAAPRLVLAEGASGPGRDLAWERIEPGHLRTVTPMAPGAWYRGAVQLAGASIPFGPVGASGSAEWAMEASRVRELSALVATTLGHERTDLGTIWGERRTGSPRDLRPLLLLIVLCVFLVEALRGRLGMVPGVAGLPDPPAEAREARPEPPAPAQAAPDGSERKRRYRRAKGGGSGP